MSNDSNKWLWGAGGYILGRMDAEQNTEVHTEVHDHHHYHESAPQVPADVQWRENIENHFSEAFAVSSIEESILLSSKVNAIAHYAAIRDRIEHDYHLMQVHKVDLITLIDKYSESIIQSAKTGRKLASEKAKITKKCKNEIMDILQDTAMNSSSMWNKYYNMKILLPHNFYLTAAQKTELSELIDQCTEAVNKKRSDEEAALAKANIALARAIRKRKIIGFCFVLVCILCFKFYCVDYLCKDWHRYAKIAISVPFILFGVPLLFIHCCSKPGEAAGTKAVFGAIVYIILCVFCFKLYFKLPVDWRWSTKLDLALGIAIITFPCLPYLCWLDDKSIKLRSIIRTTAFILIYMLLLKLCFLLPEKLCFLLPDGWHWCGIASSCVGVLISTIWLLNRVFSSDDTE